MTAAGTRTRRADDFEARLPEMLIDLERLVRCESPSSDVEAVAACALLVAELGARELGVEPEVLSMEGRTHLRWRFDGTGPRVLLVGHLDTVWPVGSLETHPWQLEAGPQGRVVRGPGCFDMKAGLVQLFHALGTLDDRHSITVLVTGDEEIGSPTSRQLIEQAGHEAAFALILEPSADKGALKTERKGISRYDIEIAGRAAHAGLEPELGINAGIELANQVLLIAALGEAEEGATVTPTMLHAGTSANTVPSAGRIEVDVRATTEASQQRVDARLRELQPQLPGSKLSIRGGVNRPPMERVMSADLFARANSVAVSLGLDAFAECAVGGGSDGNFTAGIGTPTLDGLGAVGGGAHADHEHLLVDHVVPRTRILAELVEALRGSDVATDRVPK